MDYEALKKIAALAALDYIQPGMVIGVGTGSTVDYFIEGLKKLKSKLDGVVASSTRTAEQLKALSIPLLDLNSVHELPLYIDGADEINSAKQMIKGGGGALTYEKIIGYAAQQFICIADSSKLVSLLGKFPVAIEVIPIARSFAARQLVKLGGTPEYRHGFMTDSRNVILDVYNLNLTDPVELEKQLNNIPGVVANGIFAARKADVLLLGTPEGVNILS